MIRKFNIFSILGFAILVSTLAYCTSQNPTEVPPVTNPAEGSTSSGTLSPSETAPSATLPPTSSPPQTLEATHEGEIEGGISITIQTSGTEKPIHTYLLGTNAPAWLYSGRFDHETFQARTLHAGFSMLRMPGGSWSNSYDWLGCENADGNTCYWTWAARPTDFINLMQATGQPGMWTINFNGTSKEAAALVAFFNGDVNDTRPIGVDLRGKDWGTVGEWAQLRAEHGNPDPVGLQYWEIGNEIYGGTSESGTDCAAWGWEPTWTCDGTEYVNGLGSGAERHEGFLEFVEAMKMVDATIQVGAVGVPDPSGWTNWGNEVIAAAGEVMDFYIVHEYAYDSATNDYAAILAQPHAAWAPIMANLTAAFDQFAGERDIPVAITEFNLFAFQEADSDDLMSKAINAFYLADSLGQMMQNGYAFANQWDLAHGDATNPAPSYGLMQADTFFRTPQYYVYPLWARFGTEMLPWTNSENPATTLSVYAGRVDDDTLSLLVINKTRRPISANIAIEGVGGVTGGQIDVVQAQSLSATSVTFNGANDPSDDLSNAPSTALTDLTLPIGYSFSAYSITLLRIDVSAQGE